jgi:serine protease inhibitor
VPLPRRTVHGKIAAPMQPIYAMAPLSGMMNQLRVGEKGTVASAATAVGVAPAAARMAPVAQIMFDRPYLLRVTATATGGPLFLARVANPAAP